MNAHKSLRKLRVLQEFVDHQSDEVLASVLLDVLPIDQKALGIRLRTLVDLTQSITSPIRRIPDDVLREIFLHFYTTDDWVYRQGIPIFLPRKYAPPPIAGLCTRLLSICRRWRFIISTTPRIWSGLQVFYHGVDPAPINDVALDYLQMALRCAGKAPIDICFTYNRDGLDGSEDGSIPDQTPIPTEDVGERIGQILSPSTTRWTNLALPGKDSIDFLKQIKCFPNAFPALQSLDIYAGVVEKSGGLPEMPSLEFVAVTNGSAKFLKTWLSSIQKLSRLKMCRVDNVNFLSSLDGLRNLTHLHILVFNPIPGLTTTDLIHLPQLQFLRFGAKHDTLLPLLQALCCPMLSDLTLSFYFHVSNLEAVPISLKKGITEFIRHSKCQIRQLCLIDIHPNHISLILPHFTFVEALYLSFSGYCGLQTMDDIGSLFRCLTLDGSEIHSDTHHGPVLPYLKHLQLSCKLAHELRGIYGLGCKFEVSDLVDLCKSRLLPGEKGEGEESRETGKLEELRVNLLKPIRLTEKEVASIFSLRTIAKAHGTDIRILLTGKKETTGFPYNREWCTVV